MSREKPAPACACADQPHPPRGSRAWAERVLELFDRDCMDDLAELYTLMGVPSATWEDTVGTPGTRGIDRNFGREKMLK